VRRVVPVLAALALLAGCGGGEEVSALRETVEGAVTQEVVKGDPAVGEKVFTAQGCNACHTFTPAGSKAAIGPDLDKLPGFAETAGEDIEAFTRASIVNPTAYVEKGFTAGIMPPYASLPKEDLAGLVAFLTQEQ